MKKEQSKLDFKRQMNKDILEENRKQEELKRNNEILEKERNKEDDLTLLIQQEKLKNEGDGQKQEKLSKSKKGYNLNDTYEETLRKLQFQSITKCQEIEERIFTLENRIEKERGKKRLMKLPDQKKDFKTLRPIYNLIGSDNHVSKWKSPDENNIKKQPKTPGENLISNNSPALFATQIDKK